MKVKKIQKKNLKIKKAPKRKYNNEIIGIMLLALGVLTLLSLYFDNSTGLFGRFVSNLLTGLFGGPAYILPPLLIIYSFFIIFKKDLGTVNVRVIYTLTLLLVTSALIQAGIYSRDDYINIGPFKSISIFFEQGRALQGGGVFGGIISIPFLLIFQTLGTIIILTALGVINVILLTNISIISFGENIKSLFTNIHKNHTKKDKKEKKKKIKTREDQLNPVIELGKDFSTDTNERYKFTERAKVIDFKIEDKHENQNQENTIGLKEKEQVPLDNENRHINLISKDFDIVKEKEKEKPIKQSADKDSKNTHVNSKDIDNGIDIDSTDRYDGQYMYPPLDFLEEGPDKGKNVKAYKSKALEGARKLEETLKSFSVDAKVVNVSRGPAVTRYELQPSAGVKVSKIVNLADDISLNLASSGVRIEAPIPGKAAIGIEVANSEITSVPLREVIDSSSFKQHPSKVAFAIGKDISGECVVTDIAKMPHLLIAGATGSGKSVCINSLIISLLYKASPNEVKLLMIDPKVVELGIYNGIPHLLIPVVTDPKKAAGALNWAVQEMVNRYKLFADRSVRDLKGYNKLLSDKGEEGILPEVVIIIDELADLMMVAPNDVEDSICRLAQMARAAGMHLVIATQRPSVDVITGVIKANIPSRISFAVSSQIDSRTILDMAGAEKLLGKGDMLFYPVGKPKPIRVQGAFVSEKEVEKIVDFIKLQGNAEYDENIIEEINSNDEQPESDNSDADELLPRAIEMVVEAGQASVSLIQRKFKVGYARAARIIDQMEERGIVGGFEGSKPRQILISKLQWQEMQFKESKVE